MLIAGRDAGKATFMETQLEGVLEASALTGKTKSFKPVQEGIVIAVETPEHKAGMVISVMGGSGAAEILQD